MRSDFSKYHGFIVRIFPEYLSVEERLARKEWRAIVKSYRYTAHYNGKPSFEAEGFSSEEQALEDAENRIDAILDSL